MPEAAERLRRAGFGPGRWPDGEDMTRVAVLGKPALAAAQHAAPPLAMGDVAGNCLFLSTGGTMEPDLPAAERRLAAFMRGCGLGAGDVVINGFSYHLTPAGLLFHNALLLAGCRVLPCGPQNTDATLELARRSGASGFVGIAGHLRILLTRAAELGEAPRLRVALAGGEPFGAPLRAELTARFGVACFDYYGTADVGVVAGGSDGALALFDGVIAEIVDPANGCRLPAGEAGQLVLSVDNPDYPMLRLATGDLATLSNDGRSIRALLGRVDASARVRGLLLHEGAVREALAVHPAIAGGWIEVTRPDGRDRLTAFLVTDSEAASAAFAARFAALCRLTLDAILPAGVAAGPAVRDCRG